jgi:hypothetical protein
MHRYLRAFQGWLKRLAFTLLSAAKLCLKGRPWLRYPRSPQPLHLLLGNAPSLEEHLAAYQAVLGTAELYVVNSFPQSRLFRELKPQHYVLLDDRYWRYPNDADNQATFRALLDTCDWPLTVWMPYYFRNSVLHREYVNKLPHGQARFYNYTWAQGFKGVVYGWYRRGWAMPRCRQVLQAAGMIALWRGARDVRFLGLEHDIHLKSHVDEHNQLYQYYDSFYYKEEQTVIEMHGPEAHSYQWQVARHSPDTVRFTIPYPLLFHLGELYEILEGYYRLADYARWLGVPVYNASRTSQVDCFERRFEP